jgi:ubiquinone/menaquinone biosynthesis C-methylase UbiE
MKEYIHDETVAINLGSGNSNISDKITNVDIFPFKNVNICCDIESLPIIPDSVDVIINIAVLEHVPNPENVMNEVYRVLKPGGTVFTYYPFMQPFHASPYDYSRRTVEGLKLLHQRFELKELRIGAGPTSGFLWVFQEWLAIFLSFGIKRIHHYVYLFIMIITFPLKYLDFLLARYSTSYNIASAFILIAQKK